ncbi:TMV resistance protein N-like [Abrus precatorius]|uniref:ADP-ribosyl cyclase/cyclic ADP-ribose hydrolase n=1 Tax=Abrus precatorius TaxID=3816 RepID=A0A8B8MIX5_ABRPR|nr:TMV resistance protein N-like [Abrus precatorius]
MSRGESSSNSCNAPWRWTYHIFLSFRGADTRLDFIDHLYAALVRKGIITFRDDKQLEKGDVISQELLRAIEESLGAIVILSKNYASSSWCLDELQTIIESKRVLNSEVFPVFYDVTPYDVMHQTRSFAEAFKKHEIRYEKDKGKVQKWRDALKEVANISERKFKNRNQTELIENIVESVWTKLRPKMPSFNDGLVGIDSRVRKLDSLLRTKLEDVLFIGIWGIGGIGKTTLARVVFKKIQSQFEISCFLDNVREISGETDGMLRLQRKILSHLEIKGLEIKDLDEGKNTIRNLLFKRKVLLVVDDANDISQLENLAERHKWFGPGSRVIVTTREKDVLISHGIVESYEIDFLNSEESLQLLSQKAFKRDQPREHYLELSKAVVNYAGGLPLALNLLGSFLCGRSESQWKEVVGMINEVPANHIVMKSLRISYNGLPIRYKALFLDMACFFKDWVKELATQALEICDRYPPIGIELLIEKALLNHDGFRLGMHDLLQEMGREIVLEECHIDASKRSRLWSLEDINHVLKYNKANESIEGVVLNSHKSPYEAIWDPEAFSRIYNLKLLIINFHIRLPRGLKCLSRSLKYLLWTEYSLEALPLGLQLDELVELKLYNSKIRKIWNENQFFAKLKFIDLSFSKDLIHSPIVSGAPCLERLLLIGCINLIEVHQSVGQHKKLVVLYLKGCINLQTFPRRFEMDSLEELSLSGCSKVKKLPEFGKNMKCLSLLNLENCKNLLCLPNSICNLKSLRKLYISGCSKFSRLPDGMNENESLEELDVSGTAVRQITLSKVRLENLKELSFGGRKVAPNSGNLLLWITKFKRQQETTELILPPLSRFFALTFLDLSYCNLTDNSIVHDLGSLPLLQGLDLSGNYFVNPPAQCITNLSMLETLSFTNCLRLESLPMLPPNIQALFTNNCPKMKPLNLDEQMLWKIFESHSNMDPIEGPDPWFVIPGNEIPSWFNNQEWFSIDSFTSITVDVPNHYQASEWWGIAVCLALEPLNVVSSPSYVTPISTHNKEMCIYYWVCKAPDREPDPKFPIASKYGHLVYEFNDPYIHIIFLSGDHVYIQHYLSGEQNNLQLIFYVENLSESCKATIKKCGCRVICKEDIENWHNHSYDLHISRLTETEDDERCSHVLELEEPSSNTHLLQRTELQ